jgi:hypothetical protein
MSKAVVKLTDCIFRSTVMVRLLDSQFFTCIFLGSEFLFRGAYNVLQRQSRISTYYAQVCEMIAMS